MPIDLNNETSHAYLQAFNKLQLPDLRDVPTEYTGIIELLKEIKNDDKKIAQENYTRLHILAAKVPFVQNPDLLKNEALKNFHCNFFKLLYENDGMLDGKKINEIIYEEIIKIRKNNENGLSQDALIRQHLDEDGLTVQRHHFTHQGHIINELTGLMGYGFNPLKNTNRPFIYREKIEDEPILLRFCTQIRGYNEIQPAFLNYLAVKKFLAKPAHFHHIYFNLMKRPEMVKEKDFPRRYIESAKVDALENLNTREHDLGIAVITLPAAGKFFTKGFLVYEGQARLPRKAYSLADLKLTVVNSVIENKNDFFISSNVWKALPHGGNSKEIKKDLEKLFQQAVSSIIEDNGKIKEYCTAEERQAVLFEFTKFRLPRYFIKNLRVETVNFSCKDGIDRQAVTTLWYEFRRKLEKGGMMSEAEVNMHLDASAILVKARSANENRNLFWNALQHYYLNPSNKENFVNPNSAWIAKWLENNRPLGTL